MGQLCHILPVMSMVSVSTFVSHVEISVAVECQPPFIVERNRSTYNPDDGQHQYHLRNAG